MSSNPETTRKLIYSILQFLQSSLDDGTVRADDKEGVEVAVQCIGEAFDVSPTDASLSISKPLQEIFAAHLSSTTSSAAPSSAKPTPTPTKAPDLAEAERLKSLGNASMSRKDYPSAITAYTSAISANPQNPVYFSNRAAAHSSLGDHSAAALDAESAIAVDSSFAKAYSRLGHARYSMKQYSAAAEAFRRGLELDPGNGNMKTGLENAEARVAEEPQEAEEEEEEEEEDPRISSPASAAAAAGAGPGGFDMSRAAEMLRGMGGGAGGGAGGMPDLAGLMNNPQIMQAAQQMMANGGLEQLMNNPMMRNLASQFMQGQGRGGGVP
ncbi:TPR-like protein [Calocera viscosa TUFC12733]|uniref:TPR-like protein n=1 Tax=Calocera viscosa (strain TUFC12733) TaxID=1330018 RepID=A0A167FKC2_CALVF|nr:TPR-like protein [Calocera viscosa TUFC12733]